MPQLEPFAYAVLRVVPAADRGEAVNAGVVLYCRGQEFLELRTMVPAEKLRLISPGLDLLDLQAHLRVLELVAAGDPAGGPIAAGTASARFHWLVAPSSTLIQPSAVHTGICEDPAGMLEKLFEQLVR